MQIFQIPDDALYLEDAEKAFVALTNSVNKTDLVELGLYENAVKKAVRYSSFRAEWILLSKEEKMEKDEYRTSAHDSFITSLKMLQRYQKERSERWSFHLDFEDRKMLGDFACFIAYVAGLYAR